MTSVELPGATRVALISVYELGRPSAALASAQAALKRAGHRVRVFDASVEAPEAGDAAVADAGLVAISVPMHTALRLGVEIARRVRAIHPHAHIAMFGLYAWLNARHLLGATADSVIGGEHEAPLVALADRLACGSNVSTTGNTPIPGLTTRAGLEASGVIAPPNLARPQSTALDRAGFQPLARHAALIGPRPGQQRVAGHVEASRGCLHRCLHCPITPVYGGRFFVVPAEVVLADIAQQVSAGARHISFGDPDFLCGPRHALEIARALHAAHRDLSFDATVKIEHVLKQRDLWPELATLGCVFVLSAVESLSDRVLAALEKGHTRADVYRAIDILETAGIALRPSLMPFTPWATLDDYLDLVDFACDPRMTGCVDPIQLAIRLLIPPGSALLARDRSAPWLGELVADDFGHRWTHPDPALDRLHAEVSQMIDARSAEPNPDPACVLRQIRERAYAAAGRVAPNLPPAPPRFVPRLTEAWFCCAEPSHAQRARADGAARGVFV